MKATVCVHVSTHNVITSSCNHTHVSVTHSFQWFNGLCILLLFCFFANSETSPTPVVGIKGGNVTLPCQYTGSEIPEIDLTRSENISVCQTEECSCRVCKKGACDVVIKDLSFSDAGTYILKVSDQTELEQQIRTYQLCIDDEISVKIGEELKLDVLLSNADKVQHQSRRSTGWKQDWSRTDGVQSERITIRDGNLIINEFTARDAGSYRVLDSDEEILITVKVKSFLRLPLNVRSSQFKPLSVFLVDLAQVRLHSQHI
ncbi:uncharacterized protein LOC131525183 [Onychostoma macrolepis]|uniref:uncharacterized protein LOC131525183 n=1 Tax=Onychostoma macrolepis TaxID=369639 RepID=UPI00272DC42A|nr:uncharacterized protein LOC131525183 [Onychostoma macrolepis]